MSVLGQIGLVLVGLTGGAVAVEEVFAIPGLGRATLGAAASQDLPALQAGVLALVLVAVAAGIVVQLVRRLLLGGSLRAGAMGVAAAPTATSRAVRWVPIVGSALVLAVVALGLPRNPTPRTGTGCRRRPCRPGCRSARTPAVATCWRGWRMAP